MSFQLLTQQAMISIAVSDLSLPDRPDCAELSSVSCKSVVRSSYADRFYSQLTLEAIREWKKETEWKDTYHE
jgi:hypothetical protein